RYGDRVVLDGSSSCRANAGLHLFGEASEMVVAGHDLDPGIGHSHQRAGQVIIGEPDGLEHGASRRSPRPVDKVTASGFRLARHVVSLSKGSPRQRLFSKAILIASAPVSPAARYAGDPLAQELEILCDFKAIQ